MYHVCVHFNVIQIKTRLICVELSHEKNKCYFLLQVCVGVLCSIFCCCICSIKNRETYPTPYQNGPARSRVNLSGPRHYANRTNIRSGVTHPTPASTGTVNENLRCIFVYRHIAITQNDLDESPIGSTNAPVGTNSCNTTRAHEELPPSYAEATGL